MYNNCVYIGRFQPVHEGHLSIIRTALDFAEHLVIIVGSANSKRTVDNPWTFKERKRFISKHLHQRDLDRVTFKAVEDRDSDEEWKELVNNAIPEGNNVLIGHFKDESSWYLSAFPEMEFIGVENVAGLNATDIREKIFSSGKQSSEYPMKEFNRLLREYKEDKDNG